MVEGTSLLRKHTGLNLYRGFESLALRQFYRNIAFMFFNSRLVLLEISGLDYNVAHAPVAQLDRVLGYEPRGQEFESLRAHQKVIEAGTF